MSEVSPLTLTAPVQRAPRSLQRLKRGLLSVVTVTLLVLMSAYILGPLVILFVWAFASQWFPPNLWPSGFTLQWWQAVLDANELGHSIMLSFIFAPVVTLVTAAICLPAAYAFSRYQFVGRRSILVFIFAINAFPKMGIYITLAEMFYGLHLINTFPGVVIVQMLGTIVTMTWIPTAAFAAVPKALEEAARDCGAGPVRTFFSVTLRQAMPGILIALILTFLSSLDESQGTLIVGAPNFRTMPVVMYGMLTSYPEQATAVFSILLTIPSLVLLFIVRKYILGESFASSFRIR